MSVAILLVTHGDMGRVLMKTVEDILKLPISIPVAVLTVSQEEMLPEFICQQVKLLCDQLNQGQGVLVLTDLIGATPCNSVSTVCRQYQAQAGAYPLRSLAGLNLPMLLNVVSHALIFPNLDISELIRKAEEGGQQGIQDPC